MPNPTHLYGKNPYPNIDDGSDGICSGCLGRRNIALKDDPILLCDGVGCKREYHLSCTTPELDSVPEGDFFCIDCDPEGTTACLKKYFDSVEDARCEFVSSRDYVEQQIKNQLKEIEMDEEESQDDYDPSSPSDGFYGYNGQPIFSEMDKLEELHAAAMDDSIWRDDSDRDSKPRKVTRFGPEFFIGKICKLYCPIDNSYHSGRIIDWRSAILPGTDPKQLPKLFCGKGRIATCEFRIRFPAGCNGRKVTLLKWIILEEHSCAISMDVIHACKEKGRGIHGWKPAHLMVRTKLELLPVRKLISYGGHYALVTFFGTETHIYLNVENEACSFTSNAYKQQQDLKIRASSCATFHLNKEMLKLGETLAMIELDEQRRTRDWSMKHYVDLPRHYFALTMIDEYSQELHITSSSTDTYPLEIPVKKVKTNKDENPSMNEEEGETTEEQMETPFPQLCPQIQRGLDRQWIASRIPYMSYHKSFDAIETMTASMDTPICDLTSRFYAQEREREREREEDLFD